MSGFKSKENIILEDEEKSSSRTTECPESFKGNENKNEYIIEKPKDKIENDSNIGEQETLSKFSSNIFQFDDKEEAIQDIKPYKK